MIPNTLGDLTKRENRFAHYGEFDYGKFPFAVDLTGRPPIPPLDWPPQVPTATELTDWPPQRPKENAFLAPAIDARIGDDVLLTNVLAFDVQVWDPGAPIYVASTSGVAVEPRDPGWAGLTGGTPAGFGAYVDMGYSGAIVTAPNMVFNLINPNSKSGFTSFPPDARVYDTWSLHYENDGVRQKSAVPTAGPIADAGTNGIDDHVSTDPVGFGVVDDIAEYDTHPPYSAPLRGIRVTIRVYEPSSQQVREAVIIQDFLPD